MSNYCEKEISTYICKRTKDPIVIDGNLEKDVWKRAEKSARFIDVIDGAPALYDSRAALLWDNENLYAGFWCEEPFVKATLTKRDSLIFNENDIEIFIDGGDTYYEFELNALNTVYEVFYVWQDAYLSKDVYQNDPKFSLLKKEAFTFGGNHDRNASTFWTGTNDRKVRYAFMDWDFEGLQTAVQINRENGSEEGVSKSWFAEIAFPWKGMKDLANGRSLPPREQDIWRMFMGRYETLRLNGKEQSVGWAMDQVGTDDNHAPERFTKIVFSEEYVN
ncbi:carbohydrate-binding family 9-like protein [Lacrimispora brassicae]